MTIISNLHERTSAYDIPIRSKVLTLILINPEVCIGLNLADIIYKISGPSQYINFVYCGNKK